MENCNITPNQTHAIYNLATECCLRKMDRKYNCPDFANEAGKTAFGEVLFCIVFIAVVFGLIYLSCKDASYSNPNLTTQIANPTTQAVKPVAQQTDQKIRETLEKVAYDWDVKKVDVNSDGLINCIDAAVLFYNYYPDKKDVKIISTIIKNPGGHLFNMVGDIDIEPQAFTTTPKWHLYSMGFIWGKDYKPQYNRDETYMWKAYARRKD